MVCCSEKSQARAVPQPCLCLPTCSIRPGVLYRETIYESFVGPPAVACYTMTIQQTQLYAPSNWPP